ncbi:MAG TPA: YraN family protein [Candidatus Limnocylindria bacterium]|nr:YraN family protein [Candidatus Limnocylindria bacterium]
MRPPVGERPSRCSPPQGSGSTPNIQHALGLRAEQATAQWLSGSGWQILERRWRVRAGELDLVCRDPDGALVAVEVKLRRTSRAGRAVEAIDRRRLSRLRASLVAYAQGSARRWPALRVDLVTVEPDGDAWRLRRLVAIDAW